MVRYSLLAHWEDKLREDAPHAPTCSHLLHARWRSGLPVQWLQGGKPFWCFDSCLFSPILYLALGIQGLGRCYWVPGIPSSRGKGELSSSRCLCSQGTQPTPKHKARFLKDLFCWWRLMQDCICFSLNTFLKITLYSRSQTYVTKWYLTHLRKPVFHSVFIIFVIRSYRTKSKGKKKFHAVYRSSD